MRTRFLAPAVAALTLALARCSVGDLDLEGKGCPCVDGYTCDTTTSKCVRGAVTTPGTSSSSGGMTSTDAEAGAFAVKLTAGWTTTESMRWDWEVSGDPATFKTYELVVADTADAIDHPTLKTIVYTTLTNPELGSFTGRDPATPSPGRGWAVTDRLFADTDVYARLKVIAQDGRQNLSAIVKAHTNAAPERDLQLLGAVVLAGVFPTPDTIVGTQNCFVGKNGCYELTTTCPTGTELACAFEIGERGYALKVDDMTSERFDKAFFAIALRANTPGNAPDIPYDDIVLAFGDRPSGCPRSDQSIDDPPVQCRFRWERGWSFRAGDAEWRLVQVPLKEFRFASPGLPSRSLTFADIQANYFSFRAFTLNGSWRNGTTIGFDRASLRY